jgi:CubicO group peptidase (beta-lactamase class C family)
MSDRTTTIAIFAIGIIAAGGLGFWQTAHAPAQQPASPPLANAPVPYVMSMGDLMNTLIQPRHTKLGLAGRAENWALANYALSELRQVFERIGKAVPKFRGMPVPDLIDAALTAPLGAVEAAIRQKDPQKFAAAYDQVTQGCNACHIELDHPFVVIKTPDATVFPDQDFNPRQ